jgi:hypothetical protein
VLEWLGRNDVALWWVAAAGLPVVIAIGALVAIAFVVRMPAHYFVRDEPSPESWRGRHPALRIAFLVVKNGLGALLAVIGLLMLVLPGPGVLVVLIGISLLNFPGKRRLELRIARQRHVLRAINWLRAKAGRPPLEMPPPDPD